MGVWEVFGAGAFESAIGGKFADKWVEVSAAEHLSVAHFEVEGVAAHAVSFLVDENGEVGVVVPYAGHIVEESYAGDIAERLSVAYSYLVSCFDGLVYLLQIEQSVGGSYFVHFAIDAGGYYGGFVGEAEVFEIVDALLGGGIVHNHSSAFYGVEHFGGMKGECAEVAIVQNRRGLPRSPQMGG